jgi:peptidoglycan/xylan/chitin deacetylase (PgdA/CDA1 family)
MIDADRIEPAQSRSLLRALALMVSLVPLTLLPPLNSSDTPFQATQPPGLAGGSGPESATRPSTPLANSWVLTPREVLHLPEIDPARDYARKSGLADTPGHASRREAPVEVVSRVDTDRAVVYVTVDDGFSRDPKLLAWAKRNATPVTFFPVAEAVRDDVSYFSRLAEEWAGPENHTMHHRRLRGQSARQQESQICRASMAIRRATGYIPQLLRPPYGQYDGKTLVAARRCGIETVLLWSAEVSGGRLYLQSGRQLERGDIVLLHFNSNIRKDLDLTVRKARNAGLRVEKLPPEIN